MGACYYGCLQVLQHESNEVSGLRTIETKEWDFFLTFGKHIDDGDFGWLDIEIVKAESDKIFGCLRAEVLNSFLTTTKGVIFKNFEYFEYRDINLFVITFAVELMGKLCKDNF